MSVAPEPDCGKCDVEVERLSRLEELEASHDATRLLWALWADACCRFTRCTASEHWQLGWCATGATWSWSALLAQRGASCLAEGTPHSSLRLRLPARMSAICYWTVRASVRMCDYVVNDKQSYNPDSSIMEARSCLPAAPDCS